MSTNKQNLLTTEKTILGFRPADLLGIVIMIVPFLISYQFHVIKEITILGFTIKSENINIWPNFITGAFAVSFYAALIIRYSIFKSNNLVQSLISAIRSFLDCWVLAALLSLVLPTNDWKSISFTPFSPNTQVLFLLFAIVLTWVGMKTIAGYSWIIFIFTASGHLSKVSDAMEKVGAFFIITVAISLFLQIKDLSDIKDFLQDFKASTNRYSSQIKESINEAAYDATRKAYIVNTYVRKQIGVPSTNKAPYVQRLTITPDTSSVSDHVTKELSSESKVKINLDSLDVNKDGIVDEKDFQLLQKLKNDKD